MPNSEYFDRSLRSYRTAMRLCNSVAGRSAEQMPELAGEMEEMKKAYHYALRYLPFVLGAKQSQWASLQLAYEVVLEVAERGYEGLMYTTRQKRYSPYRYTGPGCAKGFDHVYAWLPHSLYELPRVAEKLAGSIRRVKAETKEEVYDRLFVN